ncbi:MAG: SDR family oxidoreductase [Bacteroidia bacterium]|nr:SDR family oxidoreductase [Bacteroidia bacterium]
MNLKGKTILITGASSGIGESFAYLLASKGAHTVLVARSKAKLDQIAQEIQDKYQVNAWVYQKDLGIVSSAQELYQEIKGDGVDVDIIINNAGFGKWGKFEEFSLETYTSMIQLNINSLMELCYLFIEDFKEKSESGIINVGSTASFIPVPYSSVYAATKSFVLYFTEGLVGEFADTNIRISCLCPGSTASNFSAVADPNKQADTSTTNSLSSDEVARLGLEAFQAGKHYVVTGRRMQLKIFKFLSRKRVITLIADYWKKLLGLEK